MVSKTREAAVCLCGRALSTKRLLQRNSVDKSFQDSLDAEERHYERTAADKIPAKLARYFVTRAEFDAGYQEISALEAVLQQLGKKDQKQT